MIIGIQGSKGSTNEEAAQYFIKKNNFKGAEIKYLLNSDNVLHELELGNIDYGTFATVTSTGHLVAESLEAMSKYQFTPVDSVEMYPHHAILMKDNMININNIPDKLKIYSHPTALFMHQAFLTQTFPNFEAVPVTDTGLAAENLASGEIANTSCVIAPARNAELFDLNILVPQEELPINTSYFTKIVLVKQRD